MLTLADVVVFSLSVVLPCAGRVGDCCCCCCCYDGSCFGGHDGGVSHGRNCQLNGKDMGGSICMCSVPRCLLCFRHVKCIQIQQRKFQRPIGNWQSLRQQHFASTEIFHCPPCTTNDRQTNDLCGRLTLQLLLLLLLLLVVVSNTERLTFIVPQM